MQRRTRVGAYVVLTAEGGIALTQLGRGPNQGRWSLPGGGIEHGESPQAALARELSEETGLVLPREPSLVTFIDALSVWKDDSGVETEVHYLGFVFRAELPTRLALKQGGDGGSCVGARWFEPRVRRVTRPQMPFSVSAISQSTTFLMSFVCS